MTAKAVEPTKIVSGGITLTEHPSAEIEKKEKGEVPENFQSKIITMDSEGKQASEDIAKVGDKATKSGDVRVSGSSVPPKARPHQKRVDLTRAAPKASWQRDSKKSRDENQWSDSRQSSQRGWHGWVDRDNTAETQKKWTSDRSQQSGGHDASQDPSNWNTVQGTFGGAASSPSTPQGGRWQAKSSGWQPSGSSSSWGQGHWEQNKKGQWHSK